LRQISFIFRPNPAGGEADSDPSSLRSAQRQIPGYVYAEEESSETLPEDYDADSKLVIH